MNSSIREADDDDVPALIDLEALLFPNAMSEPRLKFEMQLGACFVIGKPAVAYALVRPDGPLLDLMRLGVLPSRSGEGLGRRLLEHVLGIGKPVVLTVLKANARARKIYQLAGFRCVGVLRAEGALVLRCDPAGPK